MCVCVCDSGFSMKILNLMHYSFFSYTYVIYRVNYTICTYLHRNLYHPYTQLNTLQLKNYIVIVITVNWSGKLKLFQVDSILRVL